MFYKKLISVLIGICLVFGSLISLNAKAAEQITNDLFANKNITQQMQTKMYDGDKDSYQFLFGSNEIYIDFSHAMPLYVLNYEKSFSAENASDMVEMGEYYIVPVKSTSGRFIAFAEFKEIPSIENATTVLQQYSSSEYIDIYNELTEKFTNHAGEWEIVGTREGGYNEDFYRFITSGGEVFNQIMSYKHAYLVEDNSGFNILLVSDNNEKYFCFYNYMDGNTTFSAKDDTAFYDGDIILENVREQYEEYLKSDPNAVGNGGTNVDLNYDDNELMEDTTPDNLISSDIEYADITEEPTADTVNDLGGDVVFDVNASAGSGDVTNPKTGTTAPITTVIAVVIGIMGLIGLKKHYIE